MSDRLPIWLVTGGAGFIGSNFILETRRKDLAHIINLDKLTYAGNPENLASLTDDPGYRFVRGDINDRELVRRLLSEHTPDALIHFAAESHVDRSIFGPDTFVQTNIVGTFSLLEEVRYYCSEGAGKGNDGFRFHHVSTDEVFGSLGPEYPPFTERTPYDPHSPYSASKASSDHLVRAYHDTYGIPTLITNCSNNYGPYQFPEKLIPLIILNALTGKPLPVYGDGMNIRDWLYVTDHCEAIQLVIERGKPGETYNIGGMCEKPNIEVVTTICAILDELRPNAPHIPHRNLITYVTDRPGHDRRYAIDISKISRTLGWRPRETFETGLRKTVQWYLDHMDWVESIQTGEYREWIDRNYRSR